MTTNVEKALALMKEKPRSAADIAAALGISRDSANVVIKRLTRRTRCGADKGTCRAHRSGFQKVKSDCINRVYKRAVYAAGDKREPRRVGKVNSVFQLGGAQ